MAITPEKVNFNNISEVTNGSGITSNHINYPLKASAYAQALATNQPNIINANKVGIPSVTIEEIDGTPRFKFENLKGVAGTDHSEEIAVLNSQIKSNSNSISFLTSLAESNNEILKATVEDTFVSRETANGLNVIDGSTAIMNKIKGSSIVTNAGIKNSQFKGITSIGSNNLFNGEELSYYTKTSGSINMGMDLDSLYISFNGTASTLIFGIEKLYLGEEKTYTLSFNKVTSQSPRDISVVAYFYDSLENELGSSSSSNGIIFTTPKNCFYVVIEFSIFLKGLTSYSITLSQIMLNYGNTALPYEKYSLVDKFSLSNAVELGEWDYITPQTGELIKQTNSITFTGAETFIEDIPTNTTFDGCCLKYTVFHFEENISGWGNGLSNILAQPNESIFSSWTNATEDCFKVQNRAIYLIFIGKTASQAKDYISQLYNSGTPLVVAYQTYPVTTNVIMPKNYLVKSRGAEIIENGAKCTITNQYYVEGVN